MSIFHPDARAMTPEEEARHRANPVSGMRYGRNYAMPLSDEQAAAKRAAHAAWVAKRAQGPTAVLRVLDVGAEHVFENRRAQQLSATIAILKREALFYRTRQEGPNLRVTRIAPPALPHPADGLV